MAAEPIKNSKDPGKRKRGRKKGLQFPSENLTAKFNEPMVEYESQWIDQSKIAPRLRRVMAMPCWAEVEEQLMAGAPVGSLAHYIKHVRGEATWINEASLGQYLFELRCAGHVVDRLGLHAPLYREKLRQRFGDKLAELDGLCALIEVQEERVYKLVALERTSGTKNETLKPEIETLAKLYGQVQEIKQKYHIVTEDGPKLLGIPAETVARMRTQYGENVAKALVDPISQGRILAVLKLAKQAAGLEGLDLRTDYGYGQEDPLQVEGQAEFVSDVDDSED